MHPIARVLGHSWGHLKAKAKDRISLLIPRSVSIRKSDSYLQLLDLGGGPDLSLLGL